MRRAAAALAARLAASASASTSRAGRAQPLLPVPGAVKQAAVVHVVCGPRAAAALHATATTWRGGDDDDGGAPAPRPPPDLVAEARAVLEHASNVHLLEWVRAESRRRLSMPLDELAARAAAWAPTPAAAAASVSALHDAGVVLRWRQTVFLRPADVADTVLRALPDTDLEVRARLDALRASLAPLAERKRAVDAAAQRRSRVILWTGFGLLAAQWATCLYLTFGHAHWSWDDVEPITYFTNSAVTLLAYSYYILARRALDFTSVDDHLRSAYAAKRYADAGVDVAEYERLAADVARYERYADRLTDRRARGGKGGDDD